MTARKSTSRKKATRKKATRKKATVRRRARRMTALDRLQGQLPPTLRQFANELRKRLDGLEREVVRAQIAARRRAARLLRDASRQLGRLEVQGEAGWRRLGAAYQRELVAMLSRLEKTLAPGAGRRRSAR